MIPLLLVMELLNNVLNTFSIIPFTNARMSQKIITQQTEG